MKHVQDYSLFDRYGQRKYLNEAERKRFYKATYLMSEDQKLFCLMIYWTGVRISEALSLYPKQIDLSDGVVIVRSLKKRRKIKFRQIPLPPFYLKSLKLFLKRKENEMPIWEFTRRSGSRYVKKVMNGAEINGSRACSRGLRHSFAVNCILNYVPLTVLQKWMGHSSIEVTAIYLQTIGEDERKFAAKTWDK